MIRVGKHQPRDSSHQILICFYYHFQNKLHFHISYRELSRFPQTLAFKTLHERKSGPIVISALWIQVEAYQKVGVVSSQKCKIGEKNVKLQTEKPSVMHNKHDCTKCMEKTRTIRYSPYLWAFSSGYKNEIAIGPDFRSGTVSESASLEKTRLLERICTPLHLLWNCT